MLAGLRRSRCVIFLSKAMRIRTTSVVTRCGWPSMFVGISRRCVVSAEHSFHAAAELCDTCGARTDHAQMLEKSGDRRAVSGVVGMRLGDFGAGVHAALCLGRTGCAQTATRFSREHPAFRCDEFLWRNRALLAGAKSRLRPCGDERSGAGGDRYLLFLQRPARDAWTHCCEMVFLYFLPGTFGCVGRDPYHSCINKATPDEIVRGLLAFVINTIRGRWLRSGRGRVARSC